MKIVILDAITFGDTSLDAFDALGSVEVYSMTSPAETLQRVKDADVVVTNKVVISKEIMEQSPQLKLICVAATGMNNVDLEAAKRCGISVKNVAGYSTDSVVQHTFSMLLYLIGHSRYYDEAVKSKQYSRRGVFTDVSHPFWEIKGKKWGIIGLGEIGKGVAKVAECFGADICYYSTSQKNFESSYTHCDLNTLLRKCDIVTIHAPLNADTKNLLDYEKLATCKERAVILNLGRGGIIDERAVAQLVDEREIYFGLDVFEKEPLEETHPLLHVRNPQRLYMTPHIAWTSEEARAKLIEGVVENIKSFM